MKKIIEWTVLWSVVAGGVFVGACDGGDESEGSDTDQGETDSVGDLDCDPQGAIPEVGALLNAPVEDDVEVIVKTPRHPGPPGPTALP